MIKGTYEITDVTLHKMDFTKVDDHWVKKDDEDSSVASENEKVNKVGPNNTQLCY